MRCEQDATEATTPGDDESRPSAAEATAAFD